MVRLSALALGATLALALALPAAAAAANDRIRGTVASVDGDALIVDTAQGKVTLALTNDTKYATVVKSDLSKIEKGSFIGTATKGSGNFLVALEVVIFPPSMRGTGEGHYAWDSLPDRTVAGGRSVSTNMTNGTVAATSGAATPMVDTAMTNGNVAATSDAGGARRLTVTYNGGQQSILVPPTAAIVAFQPAGRAAVIPGAHVFVRATETGGTTTAQFVAVGENGLVPPM
ncbi:MAG TPA: metal ABC transporter permease [Xanthobacteraceae bacterium]|nr:metal ABC transporter permease [Xanthobacteraceae bacterium]